MTPKTMRMTTGMPDGMPPTRPVRTIADAVKGAMVGTIALSLLGVACGQQPTHGQGWSFDASYDDAAKLATGLQRIRALESEALQRGYRPVSHGSTGDGNTGAERTDLVFRGTEDHLGKVELSVWRWDRLRPEDVEIRAGVTARVPEGPEGEAAWDGLVAWVRGHVDPGRFPSSP